MKKSSSSGRKKIHQDVGKLSGDVKVHKTEQRFEADQEFEENVKREKNTDDSSQFSDSSVSDWPVKREFSSPNDGRRQKASNRIRKCNFCSEVCQIEISEKIKVFYYLQVLMLFYISEI